MNCGRCQHANRDDRRFCAKCGAPMPVACTVCGFANESGDGFCGGCGAAIGVPGTRTKAPEQHTPRHLAEKILTSKAALEGERKQVTVLFADIKGSMELLADRDPEDARRILDPVLERMMDAVHRYEGIVNQVMGDGIMAIFGAPLASEDHAVRACYAALWMQERLKEFAQEAEREHGVPIRTRVGLNSGDVVVRSVGNDLHMDYTAVGQTTHLAARMEQTAAPGSVQLSAETLRLAEGYVIVRSLGARSVKGMDVPVQIYELIGATGVRSRFQALAARGLTHFIGREIELGQLREASEQARRGHGQIVAIIGEPGVGKTRLLWEFNHARAVEGWRVVESGTMSYGKATNYLAAIQLLRAYFDIERDDDPKKIQEKVASRLNALDPRLESILPPLLWLLDAPVDDSAWNRLDPPQRRQQALDGVSRLFLRESEAQPLIVVVEDLHWIDDATQALLDRLVESLPTARLLLLVNFRPEYRHGWGSRTFYRQVRVDPLREQSADALLDALLGGDEGLRPLKEFLLERTEGNPFFLEESVRTLVESNIIVGERGSYRLAAGSEDWRRTVRIPDSARALLASRIDQLGEHKRVLEAAAVIGSDVPFTLLQAVVDLPEDDLRQSLAAIHAAEFLYERRVFPDLEYTFRHALTHEVAYGGLLQQRRRSLHARIIDAVEELYPDRLNEQAERLAHHAVEGEVWDKAAVYLRQAGARAFAGSAMQESIAYYKQALLAVEHLPATRDTQTHAIDVRFEMRNALFQLGDIPAGIEQLREAERGARKLDDQPRLGKALASMSSSIWVAGNSIEARELARDALEIGQRLQNPSITVPSGYHLAGASLSLGDYPGAEDALRRVIAALHGDMLYERFDMPGFPGAIAHSYLAWGLSELGRFDEGIVHGLEGLRVAEAIGQPFSITWACWGLAHLHGVRGHHEEAITLLDRAVAVSQAARLGVWPSFLGWSRGHMQARLGRHVEGVSLLEEALRVRETRGLGNWRALLMSHLGEAYVLANRLDEANEAALRARGLARDLAEQGHEAYASLVLGDVAARRDPPEVEAAETYYREVMRLAGTLAMRPLLARGYLGLGTLYRRTGVGANAADHLTAAATLLQEMGMWFWEREAAIAR